MVDDSSDYVGTVVIDAVSRGFVWMPCLNKCGEFLYHDPRQEPREDPGILARKRHWEGNCTRAPPNLVANLQKVQNKNQICKINPTAPPSAPYVAYPVLHM